MATTEAAVITAEGLTKRFGTRTAVDHVDLSVPAGSVFGLLGPNGAGKTTTLRMFLGLTRPSGGSMSLLGRQLPSGREAALARVGAIIEEPRFHARMTGRENLMAAAAPRGPTAWSRVDLVLDRVQLTDRAADRVGSYSLGMKQRLGIARCLLGDPELLILDEPMNGLDPAGMSDLRVMLRQLADEGRTVIVSTHLLDEVEKACDAVAIMAQGKVIESGATSSLVRSEVSTLHVVTSDSALAQRLLDAHPAVARLVGLDDGVLVELTGTGRAAAVVRSLVEGGSEVDAVIPQRRTLEEHFLALTKQEPGG